MNMYGYEIIRENDITHFGIKGQKWGVRRWQEKDGDYNEAGLKRYFGNGSGENYHKLKISKSDQKKAADNVKSLKSNAKSAKKDYKTALKEAKKKGEFSSVNKKAKDYNLAKSDLQKAKQDEAFKAAKAAKAKKALAIGASIAAAGLAAYGGYKLYQNKQNAKAEAERERQFQKAMRDGRAMYDALVANAAKYPGAQSVKVTLPDGSVLATEWGKRG